LLPQHLADETGGFARDVLNNENGRLRHARQRRSGTAQPQEVPMEFSSGNRRALASWTAVLLRRFWLAADGINLLARTSIPAEKRRSTGAVQNLAEPLPAFTDHDAGGGSCLLEVRVDPGAGPR
jgi:hypothetical protein